MFYKRLCDQWENEADEAIAVLERQQDKQFTEAQTEEQKVVSRARGEHRFSIPDYSQRFWLTAQSLCPNADRARQLLMANGHGLTVDLADLFSTGG